MSDSNFAELRRVRTEMSAEAGHDVRRFFELLAGVRAKYRDHVVNHDAKAEQNAALEPSYPNVSDVKSVMRHVNATNFDGYAP